MVGVQWMKTLFFGRFEMAALLYGYLPQRYHTPPHFVRGSIHRFLQNVFVWLSTMLQTFE